MKVKLTMEMDMETGWFTLNAATEPSGGTFDAYVVSAFVIRGMEAKFPGFADALDDHAERIKEIARESMQ